MSGFFVVRRRFLDEVVHSLSAVGFKILLDLVAAARRPVRVGELPYRFRSRLHGRSKLDVVVGLEYLQLLADKLIGDFIPPRFVLFGLVGASGVLLHLAVLYAMLSAAMDFRWAQLVATVVVMTTNFFLNNALTWRDHRLKAPRPSADCCASTPPAPSARCSPAGGLGGEGARHAVVRGRLRGAGGGLGVELRGHRGDDVAAAPRAAIHTSRLRRMPSSRGSFGGRYVRSVDSVNARWSPLSR